MCNFASAASTGLQVASSIYGQHSQAKALQAQYDAQRKAAITQMNYAFQNYELERTNAFDSTVNELTQIRSQAQKLVGSVKAATAETQEGRTADLIVRNAEGDTARAYASVQDNYDRKSNEIDLNKESVYKSTRDYVNNLGKSLSAQMPSRMTNLINAAAIGLGNFTQVQNQKNEWYAQGLLGKDSGNTVNWWTGALVKK